MKVILFILGAEAAGLIGSVFTFPAISTWYATLIKPDFTPPSWLFGPVWTTLYALMGISAYLIWSKGYKKANVKFALNIFVVQLILNVLWSIIFFGLKNPTLAFGEIVMLWSFILLNIYYFYKINKTAGLLLVPYLAWVSFASLLNLAIALLN